MADGSILQTVKKMLGLEATYTAFDDELVSHINSAIFESAQLGLPRFYITGTASTWGEWLGEDEFKIEAVKSLIYARVRLDFDPPNNSYVTEAFQKRITELQWRINQEKEFS